MTITRPNAYDQTARDAGAPRAPGPRTGAGADMPQWDRRQVLTGGALWLLGALVLAALSFAAMRSPEFPGDVGLTEAIQQIHTPWLRTFINLASDANWPTPAGIIALAVVVLLALLRQFRAAICVAVAGFGADLLNVTLNGAVARPRPNNVHIHTVAHLGLHSYPSGHVTHVIAFYGFLLYLSVRTLRDHPDWWWLWLVQAVCLYFIVFIGPSRVLEGEHFPSDILASYLLGALVLVVGITLYHVLGIAHEHAQLRRAGHEPRSAIG